MKMNKHQLRLWQSMINLIQAYLDGKTDDFYGIVGKLEGALDASEIKDSTITNEWYDFWTPLEIRRSIEGNNVTKAKAIDELGKMQKFLLSKASTKDEKLKRYVFDTIKLLIELARKAKLEADKPKKRSKDYMEGAIMGYYSIITLLKHQAFAFCIDQKELGLADMEPDVDLLGLHRNPDFSFGEDNWAIDIMNEERVKSYLSDSIYLLKERAVEAKKETDNPKKGFEDYNRGELMAYCSVFSLLKQQASIFNIDEKELGFDTLPEF